MEKMLSRSSSWGRSKDDCQRLSWWALGAVLERPVWESLRGVTADAATSSAYLEDVGVPWLGVCGAFDLTDVGGEVFPGSSKCGDMGVTLVRLAASHSLSSVADRVADIAGRASRSSPRARTAVVGRGKGTIRPAKRARARWEQGRTDTLAEGWWWEAGLRGAQRCRQRVRMAADPRSHSARLCVDDRHVL